jgi:hypothetical protein
MSTTKRSLREIVALLLAGKKVAYVSDAGYPSISDPGERLAKNAYPKESRWLSSMDRALPYVLSLEADSIPPIIILKDSYQPKKVNVSGTRGIVFAKRDSYFL